MIQHAGQMLEIGLDAELVDQRRHALYADLGRAEHRAQVAIQQIGRARIEEQELPQIVAQLATVDELHDRKPDTFVPDFGRLWIVGASEPAADVRLVRTVAAEACQPLRAPRSEEHTSELQ